MEPYIKFPSKFPIILKPNYLYDSADEMESDTLTIQHYTDADISIILDEWIKGYGSEITEGMFAICPIDQIYKHSMDIYAKKIEALIAKVNYNSLLNGIMADKYVTLISNNVDGLKCKYTGDLYHNIYEIQQMVYNLLINCIFIDKVSISPASKYLFNTTLCYYIHNVLKFSVLISKNFATLIDGYNEYIRSGEYIRHMIVKDNKSIIDKYECVDMRDVNIHDIINFDIDNIIDDRSIKSSRRVIMGCVMETIDESGIMRYKMLKSLHKRRIYDDVYDSSKDNNYTVMVIVVKKADPHTNANANTDTYIDIVI